MCADALVRAGCDSASACRPMSGLLYVEVHGRSTWPISTVHTPTAAEQEQEGPEFTLACDDRVSISVDARLQRTGPALPRPSSGRRATPDGCHGTAPAPSMPGSLLPPAGGGAAGRQKRRSSAPSWPDSRATAPCASAAWRVAAPAPLAPAPTP